jgi:RNA polymerase sigma factor (sigma-70 family)
MAKLYIKRGNSRVEVEVSDEIANAYRKILHYEWRRDAYEEYHTKSLEKIIEKGHDFPDESVNIEDDIIAKEDEQFKREMLDKLPEILCELAPAQQELIHKIFYDGKTQREIATKEGVDESAISKRMQRIYARLKNLLERK